MSTQRLMVIVQDGKVIGTQPIHRPRFAREAGAMLVAGPNQKHFVIDAALPERFASEADISAFHRSLEVHIAKLAR
jgi:hypothetical protein